MYQLPGVRNWIFQTLSEASGSSDMKKQKAKQIILCDNVNLLV